jgi:hypothetical protein
VISSLLREIPVSQVQDRRGRNSGGRLSSLGLKNQVDSDSGGNSGSGDGIATARETEVEQSDIQRGSDRPC